MKTLRSFRVGTVQGNVRSSVTRSAPRRAPGPLSARVVTIALSTLLGCLVAAVCAGQIRFNFETTAADYYVNNGSTSCSDAGAGTQAQPYCTITAALAAHHDPGTTINVMPGRYRETVTLPASGLSGSPIVLQGLGTPSNPVFVDGTDDFSATALWVRYSGNVWLAASVTWAPKQVFADDARLAPSTVSPASLPTGSFEYVAGSGLYVNVGGTNPGSHRTQVGHRLNGFFASGKSYVAFQGFTVTRCDDRCISLTSAASNIAVVSNLATFSGGMGIQAAGCSAVRIAANVVSDNANHGIGLTAGSTGCTVEDNQSFRNVFPATRQANGLYLFGATGNVIRRNRWHDNQDTGEQMSSGSNNNVSVQNFSWANGDHGYDHVGSSGNAHIGDVAYANFHDGFSFEGNAPGGQVFDCIATDNGINTNEFDLWVDSTSTSGFSSNDNILWNSNPQQPVKYRNTMYTTVADYSAASGQDARTKQADPRFAGPASGDFHLQAGSPAIDDANSDVASWPAQDAEGKARSDDPSTPNTGLGPVTYADRGALEFQGTSPPNQPPVASLTVTPSSGTAPLAVTASASGSSDPDGTIASYKFNFGDGTVVGPQSGSTATHTYAAGTWTASVVVTDNAGATGTASKTVTVTSGTNQPPVASLTVTPSSGTAPLNVTADAAGSHDPDGTIATYKFDFGDGTVVGPQSGATATAS